jgi:hypothetical protein
MWTLSTSAHAFDFDGAWATNPANCKKVFAKKRSRISLTRQSDAFGGGFVVDGSQIRGALLTCKITSRKDEGAMLYLMASCSSDVGLLSPMQINVKIDDNNKIERVFPNFPEIVVAYARCTL